MGQNNSLPTTSKEISTPQATIGWQQAPKTVSLANAQSKPQTLNMHPNLKRELNRRSNAAAPLAAPPMGGSRKQRKQRKHKKTRRHKK